MPPLLPPSDATSGAADWPPEALQGRFEGREALAEHLRWALAEAARLGWPEMVWCDATFEDWPLGERAVAESLQAWSRGGRRLLLLACHYDEVHRRHARFVQWRRTWDHLIEARACRRADPGDLPSAFWSPAWVMQRLDLQRSTGVCSVQPERRVQLRETLDTWWRRGSPAFPASVLGL